MVQRDFIGYGRSRPQVAWPDGARLAVSIVLNYEEGAEANLLDGDPMPEAAAGEGIATTLKVRDTAVESVYEYGSRVAIWRLMDIFHKHGVPVTFFACGRALERNPEVGPEIARNGHEACGHGYRWIESYLLSREEEREDIRKCVEAIAKTVGQRPLGWFSRSGGPNTQELVVEEGGFVYDSNAFNDDIPYFKDILGKRLLVVPYSRDVNDGRFWRAPGFTQAREFFEYMKTAFARLYEEAQTSPRMMSVGLHTRISGVPARAPAIDDFIRYAKGFPGVWITRRIDIARWWLEQYG